MNGFWTVAWALFATAGGTAGGHRSCGTARRHSHHGQHCWDRAHSLLVADAAAFAYVRRGGPYHPDMAQRKTVSTLCLRHAYPLLRDLTPHAREVCYTPRKKEEGTTLFSLPSVPHAGHSPPVPTSPSRYTLLLHHWTGGTATQAQPLSLSQTGLGQGRAFRLGTGRRLGTADSSHPQTSSIPAEFHYLCLGGRAGGQFIPFLSLQAGTPWAPPSTPLQGGQLRLPTYHIPRSRHFPHAPATPRLPHHTIASAYLAGVGIAIAPH